MFGESKDERRRPYVIRPPGRRPKPRRAFPFLVRGKNRGVVDDWEHFAASHVNAARECFDWLANKADSEETGRCYQLTGRQYERRSLWQYKVTDGGRIWFIRVPGTQTVVILEVHEGHPKETEPRRGR